MRPHHSNHYTQTWFELFLGATDPAQTAREVAFLTSVLPRPTITSVLDLCCGYGRHAAPLAKAGYSVLGIDRDEGVIAKAQASHEAERLTFAAHDMSDLHALPSEFDAIICMWQSFGYLDAAANRDILNQIGAHLRPGGRFVLDIYNRDFYEKHQGERTSSEHGVTVVQRFRVEDDRLTATVDYLERAERDVFDWQLFTPQSVSTLAEGASLHPVLACTGFDERMEPSEDSPRMQLVFEKNGRQSYESS